MHNELFANRRNLGVISLKAHAREAGVVNKKFLDELINGTYGVYVQDDLREGLKLGVKTVPAFFVNGQKFEQEPTFKNLSAHIQALLDKKKVKAKVPA
jgi:protein-disulfide isomerase